jgi:spore germination protein (amino acid permease)
MLLISRVVVCVTFGSRLIGGEDIWDCIISCGITFLLTFLLVIPICFLCKSGTQNDVSDISNSLLGFFGKFVTLIYAVYYALVCAHTLAVFKSFIENVMNPPVSFLLLSTSMIFFACYGAAKGIEGLSRASAIILFFVTTALLVLGVSLFRVIDTTEFKPFFYKNNKALIQGILFFISRSSCIPALAMLLPKAKGNLVKGIVMWNTAFYILMAGTIFFIIGTLGNFASTRFFPAYNTASVAKIGKLENLDVLFLGLWTSSIFIKISLFINLSSECIRKTFGGKHNKIIIICLGALLVFTNKFVKISNLTTGIFNTNVLLIFTVLTAFIIPIILLIIKKIRNSLQKT